MTAGKTLFLCPFKAEAKLLTAILPDCSLLGKDHWRYRNGEIITWNGAGAEKLRTSLKNLEGLHNFARIVLFGAAGALDPAYKIGDIFTVTVATYQNRRVEAVPMAGFKPVEVLTVDEPVVEAAARQKLLAQSGVALVDMESFFLIDELQGKHARVSVIRFVSDTPAIPFVLPFAGEIKNAVSEKRKLFLA